MGTNSEAKLLSRLRDEATRREAFGELVKQHGQRLYWVIRRMVLSHDDADDVLQNTFIKVWENIERFRGDSQLFTWLYCIAVNETLSFIAASKHLQRLPLQDAEQLIANLRSTDVYFDADEVEAKLQAAILTLPERQRMVFNMRYFDEMPYEQMSAALGVTEGALKASYHHAVKKIESYFS